MIVSSVITLDIVQGVQVQVQYDTLCCAQSFAAMIDKHRALSSNLTQVYNDCLKSLDSVHDPSAV